MIEIYPCGSYVVLQLSKIEGSIAEVSIQYDAITYKIKYWNDGKYNTEWVHEKEFITTSAKVKIGFKTN